MLPGKQIFTHSRQRTVSIPTLVRIKPDALDRIGIYLQRNGSRRVVLLHSDGLVESLLERAEKSLLNEDIEVLTKLAISDASFEEAQRIFTASTTKTDAVLGLGGGKALDVAKYVGFLLQKPYFAVPTSLSNDGFCSPQSSLTVGGRRFSLPSTMPFGVVVDTKVCLQAPMILWWSGVGDLVAKITAVRDWKLAFHKKKILVDDFAALLSDSSVFQFMGRPERDLEGIRLMATALMLNGISMAVCGSSRPASGSEHLISHALDAISKRPRLHGLQVGVATYLISHLQNNETDRIRKLFDATDFWEAIRSDPFNRSEWIEAIKLAPTIKENFYTVLSEEGAVENLASIINSDHRLDSCFK